MFSDADENVWYERDVAEKKVRVLEKVLLGARDWLDSSYGVYEEFIELDELYLILHGKEKVHE